MLETLGAVAAIVTAMGLGGVLGALVQHKLQERRQISERVQSLKESRYLCVIVLMLIRLQPSIDRRKLAAHRPDLVRMGDVQAELQAELLNAMIYASDDVVRAVAEFIRRPSHTLFAEAASAMRSDLWREHRKLPPEVIELVAHATATAALPESGVPQGAA